MSWWSRCWQDTNRWTLARWKLSFAQCLRIAVVVAGSAVLSLWFGREIAKAEEQKLERELSALAESRLSLLRSSTERSLDALRSIAAYLTVTPEPSRVAFRSFVADPLRRLPEVQAFEWIPRVGAHERADYEARAWRDGYTSFEFTELLSEERTGRARERPEYYPVYFVEPFELNVPAFGLDLGSNPIRRRALERALHSRSMAATAPIRLAQEIRHGEYGMLVFEPVFRSGVPAGSESLRGFALVVLRVSDFVRPALASAAERGIDVEVRDPDENSLLFSTLAQPRRGLGGVRERLTYVGALELPGQRWEVAFVPSQAFLSSRSTVTRYVYPLSAWVLVVLGVAYAMRGMRHTLEIEQRVEERTRDLTREIATRRRAEHDLRATETKYRSLFENSALGMFQTTVEGSYLDANAALAQLYGYASRDELIAAARDISRQVYVDPARRDQFIASLREAGSLSDFVSEVRRKDGSRIWISETAVPVRGPDGEILHYEGSVQDITARVQADEVKRRAYEWLEERVHARTAELADANGRLEGEIAVRKRAQEEAAAARDAQSQFLASMSHEIRTPLNAIIGYSQILQRHADDESLKREALQNIVQSGHHLLTLVDDVIDLSKIESRHVEVRLLDFNLGQLISGLAFLFRSKCEKKGLTLKVEGLGDSPWWVRGDEGKLRQVLINLLGNALKFTEQGQILLRVVPEERETFRFEVIDSGVGVRADEHERIFGHFFQVDQARAGDGAGLGLAISRRLVEIMGGELSLRSTPGWGSDFYFTLPFAAPLAVVASQAKTSQPRLRLSAETPCRVLVVDDLQVNRDILRHMLAGIGCQVVTAGSGPEALERVADSSPGIAFLDVLMPGMDGIQVARAIRERWGNQGPVLVAFSASAFEEQRASYLAAGFDEFIAKPFRMERINDCLVSKLGVRFEGDGSAGDSAPRAVPADLNALEVPRAVISQIREAAELYQTTRLRAALGRLESCGRGEQALAEYLRGRAAAYDMPAVLDTVKRLEEHAT